MMMFPWSEIGGGAIVGLAWLSKTLVTKHKNGNGKPGEAAECVKRGTKLTEHDGEIKHLVKRTEEIHKENREDNKAIMERLDNFKRIGG